MTSFLMSAAPRLLPPFFSSDIASEAIVFARLAVGGEDRGIKPFLVPLHDGSSMSPGITTKLVSFEVRCTNRPVDLLPTHLDSYLLVG